jgi:hypothetical protein
MCCRLRLDAGGPREHSHGAQSLYLELGSIRLA